ncbi:NAD(P)-dependent oxidoreductase [Granulicoccus sp. GXG6511]|uniref:NAD(P)-dependent oxidoreductase n=1 Tax=Granulicoccus sp. GXG6511 TaxID=3381351 RepID=UPI003D7E866D
MSDPIRCTVIGLGATGLPIALRLADSGCVVTGVEISADRRRAAADAGLAVEERPESATHADVVLLQVTTPEQVDRLLADGLTSGMPRGSVLLLMSTVGPEAARAYATAVRGEGVRFVDVPFTGGVDRARAGELNLFVSGDPADLAPIRSVLTALGTRIECGDEPGDGQSYKMVNQLLTSVHICAAAEALALADRLGLDPAKAFEAVASGAGRSWLLSDRGPRMLLGEDAPNVSSLAIFIKDSALVADVAARAGLDARLIRAAAEMYARAADLGLADGDDSQVIRAYD